MLDKTSVYQKNQAAKKFKSKVRNFKTEGKTLKLNGRHLKIENVIIYIHQNSYIDRMPKTRIPRNPELFLSFKDQAGYVTTCTRPDLTFYVNQLSQTKPEVTETDFKRLDGIFEHLQTNEYELQFGNVNFNTAEI